MGNVTALKTDLAHTYRAATYLGPAEVLGVGASRLQVRLPASEGQSGAELEARLALPFVYRAKPGDEVLVIGGDDGHFIIGVLDGQGQTELAVQGDLHVHAVDGELSLSGDRGVRLDGERIDMHTRRLSIVADTVVEQFNSLKKRVRDLLSVEAGRRHTIVEKSSYEQAESATIVTKKKVSINGKEIHLG